MSVSVAGMQAQSSIANIGQLRTGHHAVVVREAAVATPVNVAVLKILESCQAAGTGKSHRIYARSCWAGISKVNVARSWAIRVFNGVKSHTLRPIVFHGYDEVAFDLMLDYGAPEMSIGRRYVRVHVAQADFG